MVDLNATIPLLGPVSSTVKQIVGIISVLVGGLFGLFLITLLVRIYFYRKLLNSIKNMGINIGRMEKKIDRLGKKK